MAALLDDSAQSGLFGVETVLPTQFWSPRADRGEPERRLMLAVLQDALLTVAVHARRGSNKSRLKVEEARRWFASKSRAHPFAFEAICDVLALDVSYLRSAIHRLQGGSAHAPPYRRDYAGRGRHQVEGKL